jgi:hypothetical protein
VNCPLGQEGQFVLSWPHVLRSCRTLPQGIPEQRGPARVRSTAHDKGRPRGTG